MTKLIPHSPSTFPYSNSLWFILCVLVLLALATLAIQAQSIIGHKGNPENWNRAEYPMPFGLIAVGGYTLPSLNMGVWERKATGREYRSVEGSKALLGDIPFELSLYCDAWQLGYRNRNYGNVVSFCFRGIGNDQFAGSFIEYGSTPAVVGTFEQKSNLWGQPPILKKIPIPFTSVPVIAIGKRGRFKSDNANSFNMLEVGAAYYHYLPLSFKNIYTNLSLNLEYGYGYRLQSNVLPMYLGVVFFFSTNTTRMSDGFSFYYPAPPWEISSFVPREFPNEGSSNIVIGIRAYLSLNWNGEY